MEEIYWRKIKDTFHRYIDGMNLVFNSGNSCYKDISVVVHEPKKFTFEGKVLEIDAGLSIGEFETERATIIGCAFNKSYFICGKDYRRNKLISLDEAKLEIPACFGISFEEFLRLFQLPGMNQRCRQGILELLIDS
jgi:hypothetical protein